MRLFFGGDARKLCSLILVLIMPLGVRLSCGGKRKRQPINVQ